MTLEAVHWRHRTAESLHHVPSTQHGGLAWPQRAGSWKLTKQTAACECGAWKGPITVSDSEAPRRHHEEVLGLGSLPAPLLLTMLRLTKN